MPRPQVFCACQRPADRCRRAASMMLPTAIRRPRDQDRHQGGHALRHACARRLLAEGLSLKEIGDHLGHRSTSATSIYAKVNMNELRQGCRVRLGRVPMNMARTRRGLSGQTTLPWHALRTLPSVCFIDFAGPWGIPRSAKSLPTGGHVPSWPGCSQRDLVAPVQGSDWPLQVRHQSRIYRQFTIADDFAKAAAPTNPLRLFHRRTASVVRRHGGLRVGHSPQVPDVYRTLDSAPLRDWYADRQGAALNPAGCRFD